MEKELENIDNFITRNKLCGHFTRVFQNPYCFNDLWSKDSFHFEVAISKGKNPIEQGYYDKGAFISYYSQGKGYTSKDSFGTHVKTPKLRDVLDCLAVEAEIVVNSSYENYCGDFDLNVDSVQNRQTYDIMYKQTIKLKIFLNETEFNNLLYHVERL